MKLTATQERILSYAKEQIDKARSMSFEEWAVSEFRVNLATNEQMIEFATKCYEDYRNGIAHCTANGASIKKLEKLGLIEILFDSTNTKFGFDHIRVIDY